MSTTASPSDHGIHEDSAREERPRRAVAQLLARPPVNHDASIRLADGRLLEYTVSASHIAAHASGIEGSDSDPECAIFTIAYRAKRAPATRPVCFAFNGGPGAASAWLQFGALGPKRVRINDDGSLPPAPHLVEDNPFTWLEHFDIVFIDPPHTGWSATASEDIRRKVFSVDGDAATLSEVVRHWLATNGRWSSPVLLAGESYGTLRAAAMADKLQADGIPLAGVVLVSCAMDIQALTFTEGNDLAYGVYLPAYAAAAQYHGMLEGEASESPSAARLAAETFLQDEYVAALHAGARLPDARRRSIAARVAELTGLQRSLVEEKNLRICDITFFTELLRARGRTIGRLDARVSAPTGLRRSHEFEFDPSFESAIGPYTSASQAYFSSIGLSMDRRYEMSSSEVIQRWDWNRGEEKGLRFASASRDLARAMRRNPHLRVFVASGYYDLCTPYSATDHSLAHIELGPEIRSRITHCYYQAGHFVYSRDQDLRQLHGDVSAWWAQPSTQGAIDDVRRARTLPDATRP